MTAKAFNGRIIVAWLSSCLKEAVDGGLFPDHERLHMASLAMTLVQKVVQLSFYFV